MRTDVKEKRLAEMRQRHTAALREARSSRITAQNRARASTTRRREGNAFIAMDRYLWHSARALASERYVTAFYGCRTSWPLIERQAIYYCVAEGAKQ